MLNASVKLTWRCNWLPELPELYAFAYACRLLCY